MPMRKDPIKTSLLLGAIYSDFNIEAGIPLREFLGLRLSQLLGPLVNIRVSYKPNGSEAYAQYLGENRYHLVVGGNLVQQMAALPGSFAEKEQVYPHFWDAVRGIKAAVYHEGGHPLVTDMVSKDIAEYPKPGVRNLMHHIFNIEEDIVDEATVSRVLSDAGGCFEMSTRNIFWPQAAEYRDDGRSSGFVQYLLLLSRCGRSRMSSHCAAYTKYRDKIEPMWLEILTTANPTARLKKVVKFCEWLFDNVKEIKWEETEKPKKIMSGSEAYPMPEASSGGESSSISEEEMKKRLDGEGSKSAKPREKSEKTKEAPTPGAESEESDEGGKPDSGKGDETPLSDKDKDEGPEWVPHDVIDEVFDDFLGDWGSKHSWCIAKNDFEVRDPNLVDKLDRQIESFVDPINEVAKFLTLFKGRIKPKRMSGFPRGKLDVRRAMKDDLRNGCDTRLFQQSVRRGKDNDLAVWLLGDNSGSMTGQKSQLCSRAILTLAQACEYADIPFCASCFTKTDDSSSGTSITIIQKDFSDSFQSAKPFFAINDSKLIAGLKALVPTHTFQGNSEEVNIWHVWQKFKTVPHKTKILFVLCDGGTTGSEEQLKKTIQAVEADGIIVVGIGIMASEVAAIYPRHKLFHSPKDLDQGLAPYLIETLEQFATQQ